MRWLIALLGLSASAECALVLATFRGLPPSAAGIVLQVVLPLGVAIAAALLLRARRELQGLFLACVAAVVVAVFAAEAWLDMVTLSAMERRQVEDKERLSTAMAQSAKPADTASEWPYISPCSYAWPRCNSADPGPAQPAQLETPGGPVVPLGGIAAVPTWFCAEGSGMVRYEADEHGFNNPRGIWGSAPLDVVFVGDSYTHGACVERKHTMADVVRRTWPKTLSLGMSGNGPLLELASLKEYGPALKPRVVVWVFTIDNDFSDLERELTNPLLASYLTSGAVQNLLARQQDIDAGLRAYLTRAIERSKAQASSAMAPAAEAPAGPSLSSMLKLASLRRFLGIYYSQPQRDYGGLAQVLRAAKETTESWGGRMILVFQPSSYSFIGMSRHDGISDILQRGIADVAHDVGLPYVDGLAVLRQAESRGPVFWWLSSHTTPFGHEAMGHAIAAAVEGVHGRPVYEKHVVNSTEGK